MIFRSVLGEEIIMLAIIIGFEFFHSIEQDELKPMSFLFCFYLFSSIWLPEMTTSKMRKGQKILYNSSITTIHQKQLFINNNSAKLLA